MESTRPARRVALLEASRLLDGVAAHQLELVAAQLCEVGIRAGETLFSKGDAGDAAYIVCSGELAVDAQGFTVVVREPGECIGEFSLLDGEPRSAGVVALTDAVLLRWDAKDFRRLLQSDAALALAVMRILTAKLRDTLDEAVESRIESERWRQDLERAREIQMAMLPLPERDLGWMEIAGYCRPAAEVGGDYYDYLELGRRRAAVVIADVTGHGFYSGLFVATAKSCLHTQIRFGHEPPAVMEAMGRVLDLSMRRRLLMTCCYVVFDGEAGALTYANAGHPPAYHMREALAEPIRLEALEPILGAVPASAGTVHASSTARWDAGDTLVLYSDGLTEARGAKGEEFGFGRLEAYLRKTRGASLSAAELRDGLLEQLTLHRGDRQPDDDVTLVVVKAVAK